MGSERRNCHGDRGRRKYPIPSSFLIANEFTNSPAPGKKFSQFSLLPRLDSLLASQKFRALFHREFSCKPLISADEWPARLLLKPGITEIPCFFSLLAGNPAAETGLQQTASSAS